MVPTLIFAVFLALCLSSGQSIQLICLDPSLDIAINEDCSDLRVFQLTEGVCKTAFQAMEVEPEQIQKLPWIHQDSLPVGSLLKSVLSEFPSFAKLIETVCPGERSFLGSSPDPYGINNVYFRLMNASGLSGLNQTSNYKDFFQKAPLVHQYEFEAPWNFSMKHMNEQFKAFDDSAEYTVFSMKLYRQYCGKVNLGPVKTEIELTRENPFTHTLSLAVIKYFILKYPMPEPKKKFTEWHHLTEVCLKNDKDNKTHHVMIDRVAKGKGSLEFWNSLLRVIYMGEGDGCSLDSSLWTNVKDGWCDHFARPCLEVKANKTNMNVKMDKYLRICENFLLKFKLFNGLHNCQHFATDAYDMMTGDKVDFDNWEQMEYHSYFSGLTPKVFWIDPVEI